MMNKIFIVIIVIAILLIGGYFLLKGNQRGQLTNQADVNQSQNTPTQPNTSQTEAKNEVVYSDAGYSPSELTIKAGDTVTWKNQSSSGMWTASGIHPSHAIYSGTSLDEHCPDVKNVAFDECKSAQPGESWSFTFDKKGVWQYHNHVKASDYGKIIVE